jgi:hypothetical protein
VVDWDWIGEDGLYCYCPWSVFRSSLDRLGVICSKGDQGLPSSIPKPERRIGIREIELGERACVVYSYPKGVLACGGVS